MALRCAAMPLAPMQTVYADRPMGSRGAASCEAGAEYSEGKFLRVSTAPNTGAAADIAAILLNGFQIVPDVRKGLGANINSP
jgi:hypothetical protein